MKKLCTTARINSIEEGKFHDNVLEAQKTDRKKNKTYTINFILNDFFTAPFNVSRVESSKKKLVGFHLTIDNMKKLSLYLIDQRAEGKKIDSADVFESVIKRWNEKWTKTTI